MNLKAWWLPRMGLPALLAALFWSVQPQCAGDLAIAAPPVDQGVPTTFLAETPDPDGFMPLTIEAFFSCDVPPDWGKVGSGLGLSADEKKVYGVELYGPPCALLPVTLSVYYYADGNLLYHSMDHYIRLHAKPALGVVLEGDSYEEPTTSSVSGRTAVVFERRKNRSVPLPPSEEPKDTPGLFVRQGLQTELLPLRERFVVVPAESGFYALRFSAPAECYDKYLPIFKQVTATFYAQK